MVNHSLLHEYSLKHIAEMNAELPIREALCRRAGGYPVYRIIVVSRDHQIFHVKKVACCGGHCECGCGHAASFLNPLEPHEKVHRSLGGVLSLENTIMVLRECHRRLQNNEPLLEWIK